MTPQAASKKVVIISGGQLHEREISLRSGQRLATELKTAGYQVEIVDLNQNLLKFLHDYQPDLVWPMIHGAEGESGSLQDLLELLDLPYVGSSPQGCRISQSKPVAKSVVAKNGLRTPDFVTLPQLLFRQLGAEALLSEVEQKLGYPLIVKPALGGSAMGISYVQNLNDLRNAMVDAFAYDQEVLIERFVPGIEVAVSIISETKHEDEGRISQRARALPTVEIKTEGGKYDYDARYLSGRTEFFVPARLSDSVTAQVTELALACHRVLELADFSRIDLLVDQQGIPWFIDANTIPGLTDMSLWPQAAEADQGFNTLIAALAEQAIARGGRKD